MEVEIEFSIYDIGKQCEGLFDNEGVQVRQSFLMPVKFYRDQMIANMLEDTQLVRRLSFCSVQVICRLVSIILSL